MSDISSLEKNGKSFSGFLPRSGKPSSRNSGESVTLIPKQNRMNTKTSMTNASKRPTICSEGLPAGFKTGEGFMFSSGRPIKGTFTLEESASTTRRQKFGIMVFIASFLSTTAGMGITSSSRRAPSSSPKSTSLRWN